jgi:hypothetical protein
MHTKRKTKAPPYDFLARHYLVRGLAKTPDIAKHIDKADLADLDHLPMTRLMTVAKDMGIDANALIEATEREEDARRRYSDNNPAFESTIEFDLAVEMFGKRVIRKAQCEFSYTPPWPYYDLQKEAVYEGWHRSSMGVEFLTVPEEDGDLGDSEWEKIDILAIGEVWNILEDAIEEKCKIEDAERRRIAAAKATSPDRPSRRRH